jgi:type IV pilus assembly protein PilP
VGWSNILFFKTYEYSIKLTYVIFFIVLIGCENNSFNDLNVYIEKIKNEQKANIKPLPEMFIIQPFIFDAKGLRNPFIPYAKLDKTNSAMIQPGDKNIKPDITRQKEALESFPLNALKMVGTVNIKSTLWALIKAGNSGIYRVRGGNYLGKNYGRIIKISINKVELTEMVSDQSGLWLEHQTSLVLIE